MRVKGLPLARLYFLSKFRKSANFHVIAAMDYILLFSSTHRVLKAEQILKKIDIALRLDPAPSGLKASYCDIVVIVKEESLGRALEALEGKRLKPLAVFRKEDAGYVKV